MAKFCLGVVAGPALGASGFEHFEVLEMMAWRLKSSLPLPPDPVVFGLVAIGRGLASRKYGTDLNLAKLDLKPQDPPLTARAGMSEYPWHDRASPKRFSALEGWDSNWWAYPQATELLFGLAL